VINVLDVGAVGDGVTDDAPAVQAALDASEGWVYAPAGTYRLGSLLRTPARRRLTLAPAATFLRGCPEAIMTNTPAAGGAGGYAGPGGLLIEGGVWDVNAAEFPDYSGGIALAHATDVTIRDLTVRNVPGWHAVELNACAGALVASCRFEGYTDPAGQRAFSEAIQIDAMTSPAAYPWGGPYDGTVCTDITISACWFGALPDGTNPWSRAVGSHNTSDGNRHRDISVIDCVCRGLTDAAIQTYAWDGGIIDRNRIYNPGGEGIVVKDDSRYVSVRGNHVFDAGRSGVWINSACTQVRVSGNEIIGAGAAVTNTHYGIRASGSCSYLRVTNNTVRRRASGNHARYGLSLDATVSGVQRHGNDLRSSGVTGNLQDLSAAPVTNGLDAT
jgi:Right handed beta helix region/Pectate lyase superfamily protein